MVHLSIVKKDKDISVTSALPQIDTLDLSPPCEDDFFSSVYGSGYAALQLPHSEMPEKEMPREIAYRMIKDELSLDGNPMLKYVICLFFPFILQ
jgi:glutamate decarboxylase